jgi:hypothetical protein
LRLTLAIEVSGKVSRIVIDLRKRTRILGVRAEADAWRLIGDLRRSATEGQEKSLQFGLRILTDM